MADFYFSEGGDIKISPNRDIAVTDTVWRDDVQQAYIRIQTEPGDFTLYPRMGAALSALYGLPQSEGTANTGKAIIKAALDRDGRFQGKGISMKAVPTGPQTIRFDIYITAGSTDDLLLSIQQDLGVQQ